MGQVFILAFAIAILLIGTLLFGRLFHRAGFGRGWATTVGFVLALAIAIAIEATYWAIGLW